MEKSPEAFRTISEVADWLDTPAHVLRFWESRFSQIKPVKRAGGRRYYRPSDMALLGGIKKLLHEDGMTIRGVQKILRTEGVRHVAALSPPVDDLQPGPAQQEAADEAPAVRERRAPAPPREPAAPAPERAEARPAERPAPDASRGGSASAGEAARQDEGAAQAELDLVPAGSGAHGGSAVEAPPPDTAADRKTARDGSAPEAGGAAEAPAGGAPGSAAGTAAPAAAGVDPARLPPLPDDDDPAFAVPRGAFPLADPRAARARLAAQPARAAALYERLIALAERMRQTR